MHIFQRHMSQVRKSVVSKEVGKQGRNNIGKVDLAFFPSLKQLTGLISKIKSDKRKCIQSLEVRKERGINT